MIWKALVIGLFIMTLVPSPAWAEDIYRFERMWPSLQQPWYFDLPMGVALDAEGSVYVVDMANDRIQKFTSDGQFIAKWGKNGSGDGEFHSPYGVVVDDSGYVYVADKWNNRIQKFTSEGQFVAKWGTDGTGDGEFSNPYGISLDSEGYVYVADKKNHRIQKFTSGGQFVTKWGTEGSGDGQFRFPTGLTVDANGYVYVIDADNYRIQKFSATGTFIIQWGQFGTEDGQFDFKTTSDPARGGITVDGAGNLYVSDSGNSRVQQFTSEGQFVAKFGIPDYQSTSDDTLVFYNPVGLAIDKDGNIYVADNADSRIVKFNHGQLSANWGGPAKNEGKFDGPAGIAINTEGHVYVIDQGNDRIQKFTSDGQFVSKWGNEGDGDGQFQTPTGISTDQAGHVYVADTSNHRIQEFTASGEFVRELGTEGSGPGELSNPHDVTVDIHGDVYVTDTDNNRIQKFTSEGVFEWGSLGTGDGQLEYPVGIAVDSSGGFVYVADTNNDRIQKFTSDGDFLAKWSGEFGTGERLNDPWGIAVDDEGYVYVVDRWNYRILKLTSEGVFVAVTGNQGSTPGMFSAPIFVALGAGGKIYVTESPNNRIQVIKETGTGANNKAIIVAGGGPYPGNHLWDATQMCANFAYRTLTYQGFTKQSIDYLSSNTELDLDGNGEPDDVDGDATNSNLQQAITEWAGDADNVVLYLVDHGGNGTFRMSGTETLSLSDLSDWLNTLQAMIPGKVIVIYDACDSGSLLTGLTPPAGREWIIITSTSPGESAYFVTQGSVSFSNYFWTQVFNGLNVKDAFDVAAEAISYTTPYQNALLDDKGNLAPTSYIGNGTDIHGDAPLINQVSPAQTISYTNAAPLYATDVTDNDGIARVWAVIRPPDYNSGATDNPVKGLPTMDLMPVGDNRFEATYEAFSITGTYQIAIYALDRAGNSSIPQQTSVSVGSPRTRKAIIVAGGRSSDPLWPAIGHNATLAYESLTFQGYGQDDILLLSNVNFSSGWDASATLGNISYAVNTWAKESTQDLVLYLMGDGGDGVFKVNNTENLPATDLDVWLDSLQEIIPGKVTMIYDAPYSGSFLPVLTPSVDKERIIISSSSSLQPAFFPLDGSISFSSYFWSQVLNGANVREAFLQSKDAIQYILSEQNPLLDDNGNGIGNEKKDGLLAKDYTIGVGITLAGDAPLIGSVCPEQTLNGSGSVTLWTEDVTTTGTIARVWAVISPPGYNPALATLELLPREGGRYEGVYSDFPVFGSYPVAVYAMDTEGNTSLPAETTVKQGTGPDVFENDDTFGQSHVIILNHESAQQHNFHDTGDEDWVRFLAVSGQTYTIKTSHLEPRCDTVITLYDIDSDGVTLLLSKNYKGYGEDEILEWRCPLYMDGVYYVKITGDNSSFFGENTGYDLDLYEPITPFTGHIVGSVTSSVNREAIQGTRITTDVRGSGLSLADGAYWIIHKAGTFTVTAWVPGYQPKSYSGVVVSEGGITVRDFELVPEAVPVMEADFTANFTEGLVPLTVQFMDQSMGDITSRTWDFGDSNTSTETEDPFHIYNSVGTYTVSLLVTGGEGSDIETKPGYISVLSSRVGTVTVTLMPQEAIDAGARWNVDGGAWRESGGIVSGLSMGSHTVDYRTVNGWDTPLAENIIVDDEETTSTTGVYTAALLPSVETNAASHITFNAGVLNSTVNPNGGMTAVVFEYGKDTDYGFTVTGASAGSETGDVDLGIAVTGLKGQTTYHFRARATNSAGTVYGEDQTFQTASAPVLYVEASRNCGDKTPCYETIQGAIIAQVGIMATIKIVQGSYDENIVLNTPKDLTLQGGWDAAFTSQSGDTTIHGLRIRKGKVVASHLILKP